MSLFAFNPNGPRCRVAGVVLNYCTPELTLRATETLARDVDPNLDRVFVVDNKSPDDSVEILKRGIAELALPHVSLVESDRNGGFAAGNNVGMRAANAEAYLLLNSDTIVRAGTLPVLWDTLQADERYGIVSPRLQFEDGTPQISTFRQHSPFSELIASAGTGPVTRLLSKWDVPLGVQSEPVIVPWTSFACVLLRRSVLETVGLLDEGFFMYYEDADYCRMVREAGYLVVHNPRGEVVHLRGKSSPVKEATRLRKARPAYYYEARNRFFQRAYGPLGAVAANALWSVGRGVALLRESAGNKEPHAVEKELVDNWRGCLPHRPSRGSLLDTAKPMVDSSRSTWPGGTQHEAVGTEKVGEAPRPEGRLPDFYIIGAMKCATSTLHEQLAHRDVFFMSDPKEPNFFSDDELYEHGFSGYLKLFEDARVDQIVGESSTHYTKVPTYRDTAQRIFRHSRDAKLVYVMRDPLARMASQYIHEWTEGQIHCSFDEAVEFYPRYLAYSSYARQLLPYFARFPKERILPVFFERLVKHREQELERVARFLGDASDEPFVWHEEASQTNVSKERLKTSAFREAVLRFPPARMIKEALPEDLRESIKSFWRMEGRPELSPRVRSLAVETLDRDLQMLGRWLGLPLHTENFKTIARESTPEWRGGEEAAAQ